jgi:hypothetical protein
MKLTLQTIWNSQQSLPKLLGKDLPVRISYYLAQNANKIDKELKIMNEARVVLVKKYGKEDDKKQWAVLPENSEVFNKEYTELISAEVEIDLHQFNLLDLEDVKLSAQECFAIEFMIKE